MPSEAHAATDPQASGRAYLLLTATTLCWGANAVFARIAAGDISPMLLVSLRWLGTVLLVVTFAAKQLRRDWPTLRQHLPFLAMLGTFGFTAFNGLFYVAAHSTTAVNIGIIQGALPVFVLIGAFVAYRTPVTRLQKIGVAVTMTGVIIVGSGGSLQRLAALALNRGDVMIIIACALYAGYAVALRRRPAVSSLGLFAVAAAAAFVVSLPLTAAEIVLGQFQWPTATGWMVAGLVVLMPSFLGQIMFIQGVALIGPGRAGVFINLVPVFASIMAVAFLDELFESYHAVALVLVLSGIWLSERGGRV